MTYADLAENEPERLDAFWMPFSANRQFKAAPRLITGAKGMHYTSVDRRQILDATAGLWCCNAGHGREQIIEAVRYQIEQLEERERWIKAMRRERRARLDIEQKLEALKAIELRMNDLQSHGKMPLPGS